MSVTPQDFDLDAWLDGADRLQHSVTVYQKAGLIAELDSLATQIEHAEASEELEPSLAETGEARRLRARYAEVAEKFHESRLELSVRGHYDYEKIELRAANPDASDADLGHIILAEAIVSPKFTAAQVKKFEKVIGPGQFDLITETYRRASNEVPVVSADFLPKPSTRDDGDE